MNHGIGRMSQKNTYCKTRSTLTFLIGIIMNSDSNENKKQQTAVKIVIAYPFVIFLIAITLNVFVFNVNHFVISVPSMEYIRALVIASILLIINHTWLMTSTELTRARFKMFSTPEEWAASGRTPDEAPVEGVIELKRHHDTHLNNTENIVYYTLLCFAFIFVSPPVIAAEIFIIGYAASRLGYTYSFLSGKDGARGLFMTLSLLAMYGIASYLLISLFI